ncbi:probable inactive purple acid phosphatase 27 [Tripterygium wilfordii]|uniref:probable inactive purple acid phosphatase 27 n=1 Tax=Tripterygium wilfordii TaxID=458696 RepID=UPI0018F7F1CD|nr:probable inactive purple acid phosphatase 27 [Tripterygium wilfordii]
MDSNGVFKILFSLMFWFHFSASYKLHPLVEKSISYHRNHTAISDFRVINRRALTECLHKTKYHQIQVVGSPADLGPDEKEEYIIVEVVVPLKPANQDWVALISPTDSNVDACRVKAESMYLQTGDTAILPLLCDYPVKAQKVTNDPDYLGCKNKDCKRKLGEKCLFWTCSAKLKFHIVNFRTKFSFVLFGGGFQTPCTLARSTKSVKFEKPNKPLHGHLSSIDSTGTSMKVTWVSGDNKPQMVHYGKENVEQEAISTFTTFTKEDMCGFEESTPAKDFGWHDPGYIHSAVMVGLEPSNKYVYKYGSDAAGWSEKIQFRTPPEAGAASKELRFLAFGDMGKAPRDKSVEHYIQPGSISVVEAMIKEVDSDKVVDSIFHIGDISYATGFLVEWDYFLHLIHPLASRVPYMTAIGNHERDYTNAGGIYQTPDSGGECGVPYEQYFPMPTAGKDKPWYSIEEANVHFTVISTEHDWKEGSEQYAWMEKDMASVDSSKIDWLIFTGHRPMVSSVTSNVDKGFVDAVEPLLKKYKVDLALWGHVHNYERTCNVYKKECLGSPEKVGDVDTYYLEPYTAPVHLVIGMAGFTLDEFPDAKPEKWSLVRIVKFGYLRVHVKHLEMRLELVNAETKETLDTFKLIKKTSSKHNHPHGRRPGTADRARMTVGTEETTVGLAKTTEMSMYMNGYGYAYPFETSSWTRVRFKDRRVRFLLIVAEITGIRLKLRSGQSSCE